MAKRLTDDDLHTLTIKAPRTGLMSMTRDLVEEARRHRDLMQRITAMCDRTMDGSHVTDARAAGAYDFARAVIEEMDKR